MTIVAGFPGTDWTVLAADSEEGGGVSKGSVRKIALVERPGCKCLIAGAGDGDYIDLFAQSLEEALPSDASWTLGALRTEIDHLMSTIYRLRIDELPLAQQEDAQFQLLCALWSKGAGVRLLKVRRGVSVVADDSQAIGIGSYLARYLIATLVYEGMDLRRTLRVATYVIDQCKRYAMHCGGATQIVWMDHEGHVTVQPSIVQSIDETATSIAWRGGRFLFHAIDPTVWNWDLSKLDETVDAAGQKIKEDMHKHFESIARDFQALSISGSASASPSPSAAPSAEVESDDPGQT